MTVTVRAFVEEALENTWAHLQNATWDLSHDQLLWRPTPQANTIGFQLWHVGRVEDFYVQRVLLQTDQVWVAQGWQDRFGYVSRATGTELTTDQAAQVPIPSLALVGEYLDAVRRATLQYLDALDWSTLQERPQLAFTPDWTVQHTLRELVVHAGVHTGEISYIRGLLGLPGALG